MSHMLCPHCRAEITPKTINKQGLAHCPTCQAPLTLAQRPRELGHPTYAKQVERPLPGSLRVRETETELIITRPWAKLISPLGLPALFLCAGLMLVSSVRLVEQGFPAFIFAIALLGGGLFGLYAGLTSLFNKTTLRVSPATLEIKHGPIPVPFLPTFSFDASQIKQLYVAETIKADQGWTTYQYHLCVLTTADKHIALLFPEMRFSTWEQALYFEQEIERYLGLSDQPFPQEPDSVSLDPLKGEKRGVWRKLAEVHDLEFVQRSPLKGAYLSGLYRGRHYLELDTLSKQRSDEDELYTRLLLSVATPVEVKDFSALVVVAEESVTLTEVTQVLARPGPFPALQGNFEVAAGGQEIYYEQTGVEGEYEYLQFLFDAFSDLLEAYPKIIALGGEAVPALQALLADESHPFHSVAPQLLSELAEATRQRWAERAERLRCSRCLGSCLAFQVRLSPLKNLTYYACQSCQQSQHFFTFAGQVIAVLDSTLAAERAEQADTLRVNWLARRTLFSFAAVEIIQASDEEVERFAVQVGNDTDPVRQPHYKMVSCLVAKDCHLTENTWRILQRTFGQVKR